jgi:hypothetical protein
MPPVDHLARQVAAEQDDVLSTLPLVWGAPELEDRLFGRLVDLLVEGLFLELRGRHASGELDTRQLTEEVASLATQCHLAGLRPFPGRPG